MIILRRTSGIVKNLYFISQNPDLGGKIIEPGIPKDKFTRGKIINWQVPRIKLYTSISDALSGNYLDTNLKGSKFTVYRGVWIRNENLIQPSLTDCPYGLKIEEYWYLTNLKLSKVCDIEVLGKIKEETYHYGPRSTVGRYYRWRWKELMEPWQKKSKI